MSVVDLEHVLEKGGDLLGSIGKLLGFMAMDWLSKPENQAIVKGIVSGVGAVFKFVDFSLLVQLITTVWFLSVCWW